MLEIKSAKQSHSVLLPTSIKEITPEVLNQVTEVINLPAHYCIVALCFKTSLFTLAMDVNGGGKPNAKVIPLLAKIHTNDSETMRSTVGDKIILNRSDVEMGTHLHINTVLAMENMVGMLKNDEPLRQNLIKGGDGKSVPLNLASVTDSKKERTSKVEDKSPVVYLLSFKILPVSAIKSSINTSAIEVDPFKKATVAN